MIIGIGHKKNVGKDTFANILKMHLIRCGITNVSVKNVSDILFDIGSYAYRWAGMKDAEYYREKYSEKDKELPGLPKTTPRDIAKKLGNCLRDIDKDSLMKSLLESTKENEIVIIPSIRFHNETKIIKESGGLLVKVTRPNNEADTNDVFDTSLDDFNEWDFEVVNDSGLSALNVSAWTFMSRNYEKFLKCK